MENLPESAVKQVIFFGIPSVDMYRFCVSTKYQFLFQVLQQAIMAQSLIFSLLFLLFPLSYGKPQTNSKLPCVCQGYQDCEWSKNQVEQIAALPKDHQNYKPLFEDFKAQICESKKRDVWCCRGSEKADSFELAQLSGVTTTTKITTKTTIQQDTRKIMGIVK